MSVGGRAPGRRVCSGPRESPGGTAARPGAPLWQGMDPAGREHPLRPAETPEHRPRQGAGDPARCTGPHRGCRDPSTRPEHRHGSPPDHGHGGNHPPRHGHEDPSPGHGHGDHLGSAGPALEDPRAPSPSEPPGGRPERGLEGLRAAGTLRPGAQPRGPRCSRPNRVLGPAVLPPQPGGDPRAAGPARL